MRISRDASQQYERNGFLVVRNVLSTDELRATRHDIEMAYGLAGASRSAKQFREPVLVCWRHQADGERSVVALADVPACRAVIYRKDVHSALADLADAKRLQLIETVVFSKPSNVGEQFATHSDASYYPFSPPNFISLWIALDHCDAGNGCMQMLAGSHRHGLVPPVNVKSGAPIVPADDGSVFDHPSRWGYTPVQLNLAAGDGVVFSGHTWHRSGPNLSRDRNRTGFCFRFLTETSTYDPRPGTGATFAAQITVGAGEQINANCFPIVWNRGGL